LRYGQRLFRRLSCADPPIESLGDLCRYQIVDAPKSSDHCPCSSDQKCLRQGAFIRASRERILPLSAHPSFTAGEKYQRARCPDAENLVDLQLSIVARVETASATQADL
jgi:hypothetical protein